jgi:tetratricopeptide (TPR) repeat protein
MKHSWSAGLSLIVVVASLLACQGLPAQLGGKSSLDAGREAYNAGNYTEAITDLTQAVVEDPKSAEAFYLRGSAYYGRYNTAYTANDPAADGDDFYRAATDFTKAIELNHNYAEAYDFRGLTFHGLHQPDHALADYNQAIQLDPGLAQAYYGRGLVYQEQDDKQQAIDNYQQFLTLSTDPYWRGEAQKRLDALQAAP